MRAGRSSYYPPRAGRRIHFRPFSIHLRRWLDYVPRLNFSGLPLSIPCILGSVCIPGYIFSVMGQRRIFHLILGVYLFALLIYFSFLGYPAATVAYMTMLSLHVTSVAQLIKHLTPDAGLRFRILSTVAAFFILNMAVYGYGQGLLGRYLMPLHIEGKIIVVRACSLDRFKAGDLVAYRMEPNNWQPLIGVQIVQMEGGYGFDKVLATGGQMIQFQANYFNAGGRLLPIEPRMPKEGEVVVPEQNLFVWPSFHVYSVGVPEADITRRLLSYALVSEENLVGKPFKYWFWRKQL